ncbi:MAG: hypothetical protein SAK29_24075 [Scytonema sp. PMC 1069.18]|nr:hypothetical protein [Scytonema sp. PMC 1069.18]MEC4885076.1 hypothetical protein [Scytonema sp. PMC 1070.18]
MRVKVIDKSQILKKYGSDNACRKAAKQQGIRNLVQRLVSIHRCEIGLLYRLLAIAPSLILAKSILLSALHQSNRQNY